MLLQKFVMYLNKITTCKLDKVLQKYFGSYFKSTNVIPVKNVMGSLL
jgi:hypothetical protein